MKSSIDSSILVAAMVRAEKHHEKCKALIKHRESIFYVHGITETFSTLTGGRKNFRIPAAVASGGLIDHFLPLLDVVVLTPKRMNSALLESHDRGIRGGAIYDYLHLVSARNAGAQKFYTLNTSHFAAFHRSGDPEICLP